MDRNAWQALAYSEILSDQTVVDKAIYGQADYDVTDKLRVTVGGRYSWERNSFSNAYYLTDAAFTRTRLVYSVAGLHEREHNFSPKIGVDYRWTPYLMTYASWTKGSKSGGFNRSASTAQIANLPVAPETVTAIEAGVKGRTPNGFAEGSFAIYHNDFKNFQSTITNPTVDGRLIVGNVVANAAEATTYGWEAEATVRPVQGLTIRGAAAYLHARFDDFANPTGAAATNYTGKWLPFGSKWIASASVNYVIPVSLPGELSARVSVDYHSPAYSDNANRAVVRIPTQLFTDLGVNYAPDGGHWNFLLLAKNLFNKTTVVGYMTVTPSLGVNAVKYGAPRLVTASAKYSF
jgi:iron complex outermembrane receptor protein